MRLASRKTESYITYVTYKWTEKNSNGILGRQVNIDRKSTRLNSSHLVISYAVFCLKKKNIVLSPDTGRRHVIVALNEPVVSPVGDTNRSRVGPYRLERRPGLCPLAARARRVRQRGG